MGASASVSMKAELEKPVDATDIRESNELIYAKNEIIRLRMELGNYAKNNNSLGGEVHIFNFAKIIYDASDLVIGENDSEDFERCIREISHVRSCLRLSTQSSIRKQRNRQYDTSIIKKELEVDEGKSDDDSKSSEGSNSDNESEYKE